MAGVNKVIIVGNLGADPEVKYTATGTAVAKLRIATSESWTNKDGNRDTRTEWHRVVVWNKLAEMCNEYLKKGRQVYIEGKLQTNQWQDKDGNTRYTTEIIANTVQFLGSKQDSSVTSSGGQVADSVPSFGPEDETNPSNDPNSDIPF